MNDVDALVTANIDIAEKMAGGALGMDLHDARSAAYAGLLSAAQSWDPARGASFKTFAYLRIGTYLKGVRLKANVAKRIPAAKCRSIDDEDFREMGEEEEVSEQVGSIELQRRMQKSFRNMPIRAWVVMTALGCGLNQSDIGFMLGMSVPAVAAWKRRGFALLKKPEPLVLDYREKRNRRLMRMRFLKVKYMMRGLTKTGSVREPVIRLGARNWNHEEVRAFRASHTPRETILQFGLSRGALQNIMRNTPPKPMKPRPRVAKLIRLWAPVLKALES